MNKTTLSPNCLNDSKCLLNDSKCLLNDSKCLYCYKPLKVGQTDYHPACAKKLFGTKEAPILPYMRNDIGDLANQVVRSQTTLTGVQAKMSIPVARTSHLVLPSSDYGANIFSSLKPTAIVVFRKSKI